MFDLRSAICDAAGPMARWVSRAAYRTSNIEHLLAYRPFLDPAPIDRYWLLLLPPLIVIVAVVYRTIKTNDLRQLPRGAGYLALQIAVFMLLASIGLYAILRVG